MNLKNYVNVRIALVDMRILLNMRLNITDTGVECVVISILA